MDERTFDEKQYVVFKLGVEVFGLDINKVKEIIIYQDTTKLPGTGQQIEGVINLRGHIIPIYDLRKRFGFPEGKRNRDTRIVVVEVQDSTLGIIVDGVSEVLMIPAGVIEKPSAMISTGVDAKFIAGIAKTEEGLIILLNLEKVLNSGIDLAV